MFARSLTALGLALACAACTHEAQLPAMALNLNRQGAAALAAGQLEIAEARVALALEYNPRFTEAWVNLGLIELRRGGFERARADFVKARDLNPDLPAPHHALGVLYEDEGRPAEAEAHYRAALKVDPGFAAARWNLSHLLVARGALEEAREQLLRLTEVAPTFAAGWSSLADVLLRLGRADEASAVILRAHTHGIDSPALVVLEGRALLARGAYADAEDHFEPLTHTPDPKQAGHALGWMAVALIEEGDQPRARDAAARAFALAPDDPVAKYAARVASKSERR